MLYHFPLWQALDLYRNGYQALDIHPLPNGQTMHERYEFGWKRYRQAEELNIPYCLIINIEHVDERATYHACDKYYLTLYEHCLLI